MKPETFFVCTAKSEDGTREIHLELSGTIDEEDYDFFVPEISALWSKIAARYSSNGKLGKSPVATVTTKVDESFYRKGND